MKTPFYSLLCLLLLSYFLSSCHYRYGAGNYVSAIGYVAKPFHGVDSSKHGVYVSGSAGTNFGKGYTKRERSTYGGLMAHYAYSAKYLSIAAGASGFMGSYCMVNNMYPRGNYNYFGFTSFLDASYDQNSRFGTWRIVSLRLATSYEQGEYFELRKKLVDEKYLFKNQANSPLSTFVGISTEYLIHTRSPFSYGFRIGAGNWWNERSPKYFQYNTSFIAQYKKFHLAMDFINQARSYEQAEFSFTAGQIQFGYRF